VRFDPGAPPNAAASPSFGELQLDGRSADEVLSELKQLHEAGKIPLLRWIPPSPAGGGQRPLDDFEWGELLKIGTPLNTAWTQERDRLVAQLAKLHGDELALVLDLLPQPNSSSYWWSQRPGPEGSQRLIEDFYTALQKAGVHTVLQAWEPELAAPAASQVRPAPLAGFSPGPGLFDLLLVEGVAGSSRGFGGRILLELAGSKPVLFMPSGS
jgi:hypothetical protein